PLAACDPSDSALKPEVHKRSLVTLAPGYYSDEGRMMPESPAQTASVTASPSRQRGEAVLDPPSFKVSESGVFRRPPLCCHPSTSAEAPRAHAQAPFAIAKERGRR